MTRSLDLPGTDPSRCEQPYSFGAYLQSVGEDFWSDDPELAALLAHHGLDDPTSLARLEEWGAYAATVAAEGADATDRPGELPRLVTCDSYGQPHPVGVELPDATRVVLADSLEAGLAYEPNVQLRYALAYLSSQVGDAGVMCPLACTDGLVRSLQELSCGEAAQQALQHILRQDEDAPVHGAQFVTEVQGGSDAGTNRVRAVPQGDGSYRLYGQKWFCSNIWAQYWAVTARPQDAPEGSRGVALFMVPRELPLDVPNGFRIDRIKDKLGTRSLPTVEMTLDGAVAWPMGDERSGLSNVVRIVLTTSRFWCAMAATGFIRSAERIATAYAGFREAFGQPIAEYPLVAQTLADLQWDRRRLRAAAFELLATWERFVVAERAGDTPAAEDALRTRLLVMMAKMVTTRRATSRVHDAMMILGGNGIEERFSALPRLLRDAIILETWEGPHGLLTARLMQDMHKYGGSDDPRALVTMLLGEGATDGECDQLGSWLAEILSMDDEIQRTVAFSNWVDACYDSFGEVCWRRLDL